MPDVRPNQQEDPISWIIYEPEANGQLTLTRSTDFLRLPSCLYGFHNTETTVETTKSQRTLFCHKGFLDIPEEERVCSCCGKRMLSKRSTLQKKDADAGSERVIHKGSPLFKTEDIKRKNGYEAKYDALLNENRLLFTLDLIKEKLSAAYALTDEPKMTEAIIDIIDLCKATGNGHLLWFGNLLDSHFEGIIAHATYKISAGKIEGINQKIKTLRRHGYGYPDDEYFFLKIMDASQKEYVRNQPSHRKSD